MAPGTAPLARRRSGKDLPKPRLRRSSDFAYENLAREASAVSPFDRANDPPAFPANPIQSFSSTELTTDSFLQLSLNATDVPAAWALPAKRRTASTDANEPWSDSTARVVKTISSSNSDDFQHPVDVAFRRNTHEHYFTDKPQNFSIPCSPVRKAENTLNSLDCSFDGVNIESTEMEEASAAELKWIAFGEQLGERNRPSKCIPETSTDAFGSSFFLDINTTDASKKIAISSGGKDVAKAVIRLEERMAALERLVHGVEYNANATRVSDSTQPSSLGRAQDDVAFVIEGTETLQYKSFGGGMARADGSRDTGKKSVRTKLSLKRIIESRFFGRKWV